MIGQRLSNLQREADRICEQIRRLEQLPIKDAAKLLNKSPRWIRANLPVVILGPRSSHVRASDVEEFLQRRTILPNGK